jgi:hypothetical protein
LYCITVRTTIKLTPIIKNVKLAQSFNIFSFLSCTCLPNLENLGDSGIFTDRKIGRFGELKGAVPKGAGCGTLGDLNGFSIFAGLFLKTNPAHNVSIFAGMNEGSG